MIGDTDHARQQARTREQDDRRTHSGGAVRFLYRVAEIRRAALRGVVGFELGGGGGMGGGLKLCPTPSPTAAHDAGEGRS